MKFNTIREWNKTALFILGLFISLQYLGLVLDKDWWPFSHFPMYSKIPASKEYSWPLYEVIVDGQRQDIIGDDLFSPFSAVRFNYAFRRYYQRDKGDNVRNLIKIVQANLKELFPGKKVELRIYLTTWNFEINQIVDEKVKERLIFEFLF